MTDTLTICMIVLFVSMMLFILVPVAYAVRMETKAAKARGELAQYDERQRMIRCRAAMHALVCVLVYLVVWAFLDLCGVYAWTNASFVCAMLAVILAYGVWMGECVLRDVAVGWNIKPEKRVAQPRHVFLLFNWGVGFFIGFDYIEIKVVAGALSITAFAIIMLDAYANQRRIKAEMPPEDLGEEVDAL